MRIVVSEGNYDLENFEGNICFRIKDNNGIPYIDTIWIRNNPK